MTVASVGTTSGRLADVVERLDVELARWQTPGLSVAVVDRGTVLLSGGVGRRSVDRPAEVGAATLFHHGSCCKSYTALMAAVLHERGVFDIDAPVRDWVPELRLPADDVAERVTVRDLLAHRSGISRHDLVWILNPSWDREELVRRLEHLPMASGLRERWGYSNLGYSLAGLVMERASGGSWADGLRAQVLEPLGMVGTTTSVAHMQREDDAASPHILRGGGPQVVPLRELVGAAPAGSLMTSAQDASRWLLLQAGASDAVSPTAVTTTHQVHSDLPEGMAPFPEFELNGYGLGWLVGSFRGRSMLYHSGGVDGFTTHTFVLPEQQGGVTVSANMHASMLPMAAALQIVDALLDTGESTSWSDTLHPMQEAALAMAAAQPQPANAGSTLSVDDLAGTYRHAGYGDLVLTADGESLVASLGESELRALPGVGDAWELRYDVLDAGYPLTAESDASNRVKALIAPFDPTSLPIRFTRQESL